MKTVAASLAVLAVLADGTDRETLHNGIELSTPWPPRRTELPDVEPGPPYLAAPPGVIPIDVGRQLFVDDFLIERTDLVRRFHRPVPHPSNPVLAPDRPWEKEGIGPMAVAQSVWVDPADGTFKMWYMAGYVAGTALAISGDGIRWEKPALRDGTNLVWPGAIAHTVLLDHRSKDPERRFKTVKLNGSAEGRLEYHSSPDGIRWSQKQWTSGRVGDCTTLFFNPFRNKWVFSVRHSSASRFRGRIRRYWEIDDFDDAASVRWGDSLEGLPLWTGTDRGLDPPRPDIAYPPELYNLDAEPYESLLLGQYSIFRGYFHDDGQGRAITPGRPKSNEVFFGTSRDGFHWHRPVHEPFLALSERRGDWNWGNVRSTSPGFVVVGDQLYVYYNGRAGAGHPGCSEPDAGGSTGLAILRRDGFASMDAEEGEKTLTTRTVRFRGKHLLVNVDAAGGELRAEILDPQGKPVPPFTIANCAAVRADTTIQAVTWDGAADLALLAGQDVKFRFRLRDARLFAFWVSPTPDGASHGYVAGGGPGFTGPTDTLGIRAYPANRTPFAYAGPDRAVSLARGQDVAAVSLDGSRSRDLDGMPTRYEWRIGKARAATGPKVTLSLPAGTHTITLAVTDEKGATGYDQVSVRVSPATEETPPRRERLVLWLKADDLPGGAEGAPVATWPDASGNQYDPFQKDAARRPTWRRAAANGKPAVRFDGTDDFLRTTNVRGLLHSFHHVTVVAVFKPEGPIANRSLVAQDWATLATLRDSEGLAYHTAFDLPSGGGTRWVSATPARKATLRPDAWTLGVLVREGKERGQTRIFVNGERTDNGEAIAYHTTNSTFAHIGCGRTDKEALWKGEIAEILIYADALGDPDRKKVQTCLARKYGLQVALR